MCIWSKCVDNKILSWKILTKQLNSVVIRSCLYLIFNVPISPTAASRKGVWEMAYACVHYVSFIRLVHGVVQYLWNPVVFVNKPNSYSMTQILISQSYFLAKWALIRMLPAQHPTAVRHSWKEAGEENWASSS